MPEKTVSQLLQEGRARIAAGWCQASMHKKKRSGPDQFCAYGAMWWPAWECENDVAAIAVRVLFEALPTEWESLGLFTYNDAPERTQADILALYDRALTEVTK